MDLSLYDSSYVFVLNGHIGDWTDSGNVLNDGFEEFFLTGGLSVGTPVPVPTPVWLLGFGLIVLIVKRRVA